MKGKAAWAVLTDYLASLVMTILFPLQWMRMLRVAKQHQDLDPNASKKVALAIVLGVVFAGIGTWQVVSFQANATDGIYDTLDGRLANAMGESEYNEHVKGIESAHTLIALADRKIGEAQAAGDADAETTWKANKETYEGMLVSETENQTRLEPNHALFGVVSARVQAHDDAGAKAVLAARGAIDYKDLDANAAHAFERKDDAQADMASMLTWFVYPGLVGAFYAPLVFALGAVLKRTFVPSETVGFRNYPGTAMALFLLLGGFGVPALFFAAWTFQDVHVRTVEGQFAL